MWDGLPGRPPLCHIPLNGFVYRLASWQNTKNDHDSQAGGVNQEARIVRFHGPPRQCPDHKHDQEIKGIDPGLQLGFATCRNAKYGPGRQGWHKQDRPIDTNLHQLLHFRFLSKEQFSSDWVQPHLAALAGAQRHAGSDGLGCV